METVMSITKAELKAAIFKWHEDSKAEPPAGKTLPQVANERGEYLWTKLEEEQTRKRGMIAQQNQEPNAHLTDPPAG